MTRETVTFVGDGLGDVLLATVRLFDFVVVLVGGDDFDFIALLSLPLGAGSKFLTIKV